MTEPYGCVHGPVRSEANYYNMFTTGRGPRSRVHNDWKTPEEATWPQNARPLDVPHPRRASRVKTGDRLRVSSFPESWRPI